MPSVSTEIPIDILLAASPSDQATFPESIPDAAADPAPPAQDIVPSNAHHAVFSRAAHANDDLSSVIFAPSRTVDDVRLNTAVFRSFHAVEPTTLALTPPVDTPLIETPLIGPVGVAGFEEANNEWRANVDSRTGESEEPALIVPAQGMDIEAREESQPAPAIAEAVPTSPAHATNGLSTDTSAAQEPMIEDQLAVQETPRPCAAWAGLAAMLIGPRMPLRLRAWASCRRRARDDRAASRAPPNAAASHEKRRGERWFRPVSFFPPQSQRFRYRIIV